MKKFRYYLFGATRDGKAALCFLCAVVCALGIFGIGRGGLDSFITEDPNTRLAAYIVFGIVGGLLLATLLWKMWGRRFNVADWTAQILLYTAIASSADLAVFYGTEIFIPLLCAAIGAIVLSLAIIFVRAVRVNPEAETLEIVTGKPNLITYAAQLFRGGSLIVSIGAAVVIALFVDVYLRKDFFADIKTDSVLKFAALIVLCLVGVALLCGFIQRLVKKRICLTDGVFFTLTLAAIFSLYPILSTFTTLRVIVACSALGVCLIAEIALICSARLSQYVCAEQKGMKSYAKTFGRRVPVLLVTAFALVAFFLVIRADELGFWTKLLNTPVRIASMVGGVAAFLLVCFTIGATARTFGMFDSFTLFLDEVALLSVARCLAFESSPASYAGMAVLAAFGVLMTLFRMGNAYVPGFKEAPPAPIVIELADGVLPAEATDTAELIPSANAREEALPEGSAQRDVAETSAPEIAQNEEKLDEVTLRANPSETDGNKEQSFETAAQAAESGYDATECENDFVEIPDEICDDETDMKLKTKVLPAHVNENSSARWDEPDARESEAAKPTVETRSAIDRDLPDESDQARAGKEFSERSAAPADETKPEHARLRKEFDYFGAFAQTTDLQEDEEADDGNERDNDADGFTENDAETEHQQASGTPISETNTQLFFSNPFPPKKSYLISLRTLPDAVKGYYSQIKNELLRYGMRSRISEHKEEFRRTGLTVSRVVPERKLRTQARLVARKNSVLLYLNIDADALDEARYHQRDVSDKRQFRDLPTLLRISSRRMADRALELIAYLAGKEGFNAKRRFTETDFTVELASVGLTEFERNGYGYLIRPYASLSDAVEMSALAPKAIEIDATQAKAERLIRATLSTDELTGYAKFGVINLSILRDAGAVQPNCNYLIVTEGTGLGTRLTVRANEFTPAAGLLIALAGGDAIRETESDADSDERKPDISTANPGTVSH